MINAIAKLFQVLLSSPFELIASILEKLYDITLGLIFGKLDNSHTGLNVGGQ